MNRWSAVMVLGILLSGCGRDVSEPPGTDVSGTYVGHSVRGLRATGPNADAASDTTAVQDSATYTLRIRENDGFVHGVWTIEGDTAQPSDPWEAVITGDYTDGRMVLEYYSPTKGQCHLAGGMTGDFYTPEHRCADDWSAVDTLQLVKLDTLSMACSPGSQVWMSIPVCAEGSRDGYDRDAFGSSSRYQKWEDEIVAGLPKSGDQVYTPYSCTLFDIRDDGTAATDIDHIVALSEAYDSGLDSLRFREFAADTLNLTIAVPTVNRHQKSDKDAAGWSPTNNRGWFAARVVAVKQKYGMSVNPAERDSLAVMLAADSSRTVVCSQSN